MRKYNEYRKSGVEWLGKIPAHWPLLKLKYTTELNSNESAAEANSLKIALENIESGSGKHIITETPGFEGIGNVFHADDILFSKLRPYLAKVLQAKTSGLAVGEILVLTPHKDRYDSRFLFYRLLSQAFITIVDSSTYGSKMPRASWTFIKELKLPVPPLAEQRAIAAYLDHKTAQLDTLLAQKETLMRKLHQKRQALINEAVTQGLDPDAPRKPSGVAWLEEVPAHWEVKKLKQVAENVQTGFTPPTDEPKYYEEGTIDWFAPSDFGDHLVLQNAKKKITSIAIESGNARSFKPQTVLLIGIGATLGKVGICETTCSANQQINAISFKDNYNPYFATYYLKAINQIIVNSANTSTMPILNQTGTKELYCLCPPLAEQQAIVDYIEARIGKINEATTTIHTQIQTLKAYRQSLISEVVTGKVDVRTALPALAPTPTTAPSEQPTPPRTEAGGQLGLF